LKTIQKDKDVGHDSFVNNTKQKIH